MRMQLNNYLAGAILLAAIAIIWGSMIVELAKVAGLA